MDGRVRPYLQGKIVHNTQIHSSGFDRSLENVSRILLKVVYCPDLRRRGQGAALEDVLVGELRGLPKMDEWAVDSLVGGVLAT